MKLFRFNLLLLTAICSTVLIKALAAEPSCSSIEIKHDDKTQIVLHQMNGMPLYGGRKTFNQLINATKFKIQSGSYSTIGYIKYQIEDDATDTIPLFFTLEIQESMAYTLAPTYVGGHVVDIDIKTEELKNCSDDFDLDVSDFIQQEKVVTVTTRNAQTHKVQSLLASILKASGESELIATSPEGYSTDIGMNFSKKQNPPNVYGIEVLSVTPFSPSSHFGLRSGDILLELNGIALSRDVQTNLEVINHILVQSYPSSVAMKIQRSGQLRMLKGEFIKSFVPRFTMKVKQGDSPTPALLKYVAIDDVQRYQLDNIVSKLSQQLKVQLPDADMVNIVLPRQVDNKFGIDGVKYSDNGIDGILVNEIKPNSLAEQLGILQQDVLVSLNGKSPGDFTNSTFDLNDNNLKTIEAEIVRSNQKVYIKKSVKVNFLPDVELNISLNNEADFMAKRDYQNIVLRKLNNRFGESHGIKNTLNTYDFYSSDYMARRYSENLVISRDFALSHSETRGTREPANVKSSSTSSHNSTAATSVGATHRSVSTDK